MNNKKLGTAFEREICQYLAKNGWWVHFIAPAANGGQPFDIIAVKDGDALAADCKTTVANRFSISRLEQNQIFAFERWLACGNDPPFVFIKYGAKVYMIPYSIIKSEEVIDLNEYQALYEI